MSRVEGNAAFGSGKIVEENELGIPGFERIPCFVPEECSDILP
jgi:hypothetical protein